MQSQTYKSPSNPYSTPALLKLYSDHAKLWAATYEHVKSLRDMPGNGATVEAMADVCLILKKSLEKQDDTRKEINKTISVLEKHVCLTMLQRGMLETIRGDLCTASDNSGSQPPYLKRRDNPELFDKVMMWFGFSKEACEREIARLHWPSAQEYIKKQLEEGAAIPDYIEQLRTATVFGLVCRVAAGVDLDREAMLQGAK